MLKKATALVIAALFLCGPVFADIIVLKDDQQFQAEVKNFDSFYLNVELSGGTPVSIPWNEVRMINHTTTASSWLEETHITKDDNEVNTLVVPLDENRGLEKALFPGLIMHGAGQFYAKDQNMGMSLLSAEIVSVIVMGISLNEVLGPNEQDDSLKVSKIVFYSGLTMFVAAWLWDIFTVRSAVSDYNSSHKFLIDGARAEAALVTSTAAAVISAPADVTATGVENTKGENK